MKTALPMALRVCLALLMCQAVSAGFFPPGTVDESYCMYGDESTVPDGSWAKADSGEICQCVKGYWDNCYSPPPPAPPAPTNGECVYLDIVGHEGDMQEIDGNDCTCNGVNWECTHVSVPPKAGCHANGHWVPHGHDYICEVATCTCENGHFVDCKPHTHEDKACIYDGTTTHDGDKLEIPGFVCTCDNGKLEHCEEIPKPPVCYFGDGEMLESGDVYKGLYQTCTCKDGLLVCVPHPPQDCIHGGDVVVHGTTCSDERQTCECFYGQLVNCKPLNPDDCVVDGLLIEHGTIYTDDHQSCHCDDGKATCGPVPQDRVCVFNGVDIAHLDFFNTYSLRCQCVNAYIVNCQPLYTDCVVEGDIAIPHGHPYSNSSHVCKCLNGDITDCVTGDKCITDDGTVVDDGDVFSDGKKSCACNDGKLTCVPVPTDQPCHYKGKTIHHADWFLHDDDQYCQCFNGHVINCGYTPPKHCKTEDGKYISHGSTYQNTTSMCMCQDGHLSCEDNDSTCHIEGKTILDGDRWSDGTQICLCTKGDLSCFKIHTKLPCYNDGVLVPHLDYFDSDHRRCQCVNSQTVNCMDICEVGHVETLFLFDRSSSLNEDEHGSSDYDTGRFNWESMRDFTAKIVEQLPFDSVTVGYSSFADHHRTEVAFTDPLSSDKNGLLAHLDGWYPALRGDTHLGNALTYVHDLFIGGSKTQKVIVVLTDGQADDNMAEVAKELQDKGFIIFGVAVGNAVDYKQLLELTGNEDRILMVDNFQGLEIYVQFLKAAICAVTG